MVGRRPGREWGRGRPWGCGEGLVFPRGDQAARDAVSQEQHGRPRGLGLSHGRD